MREGCYACWLERTTRQTHCHGSAALFLAEAGIARWSEFIRAGFAFSAEELKLQLRECRVFSDRCDDFAGG